MIVRALGVSPEAVRQQALGPVSVAVIDSGIDGSHPELADRIAAAWAIESPSDDAESNRPRAVEVDSTRNNDVFGHGTGVAGVIARIAPNARIIDLRVLDSSNKGTGQNLVKALEHAIELGADIINMSLAAKRAFAPTLAPLCERAYHSGQTVVAARRNMPLLDQGFPAELSSVISVDQERMARELALRYRAGKLIEFAAHGEGVVTAAPGGGHTTHTGTSFATPAVSAICCLYLGAFPGLRPFELKTLLKAHAEPIGEPGATSD